jgi:putative proteasome-type protease
MRLDEGLVFMSDTRTNAGLDNVGTYGKMHVFQPTPDRTLVLQSAGNLATTQEVIDRIGVDLRGEGPNLATFEHLFEAALYIGRISQDVASRHRAALSQVGADGTSTFILGGQIRDDPPDILLVYPEGNYIRASDDRPFLQIGETKYGKFMLELAVRSHADLITATKIALGSMMSTARANLSVGPPYDVAVYVEHSHRLDQHRFTADSPALGELARLWESHLLDGVAKLPYLSLDDLRSDDGAPNPG